MGGGGGAGGDALSALIERGNDGTWALSERARTELVNQGFDAHYLIASVDGMCAENVSKSFVMTLPKSDLESRSGSVDGN